MIVQLPMVCTDRMKPLQGLMKDRSQRIWISNFDDRPGRLFDGLEHIRACIVTLERGDTNEGLWTTRYNRWYSEAREHLFSTLSYYSEPTIDYPGAIAKDLLLNNCSI
jgi:hypothetical protein